MRLSIYLIFSLVLALATGCNLSDKTDDGNNGEADVGAEDARDGDDDVAPTCDDATTNCDGTCVDLDTSSEHCGTCGRACEAPNAVSSGCEGGVCQLACESGFFDENDDLQDPAGDGCEATCEPTEGGTEICDLVDNDCDGEIDEGVLTTWYLDVDGDGFGQDVDPKEQCDKPSPRYVEQGGDCDDANDAIHPDATEVCDEIDNDCDEDVDEEVQTTFYIDTDGDGWGFEGTQEVGCTAPDGYVDRSGDCDDSDPNAHPEQTGYFAEERHSGGFDYDCSGSEEPERVEESVGGCIFVGQCGFNRSRCNPHPDADGWRGGIPACGDSGDWFAGCQNCIAPLGTCSGTDIYQPVTQRCR